MQAKRTSVQSCTGKYAMRPTSATRKSWRLAVCAHVAILYTLFRGVHTDGNSDCPCRGLPLAVPKVDCDATFAFNGTCVVAEDLDVDGDGAPDAPLYPADYGSNCKKHAEPGQAGCWNLTTGEELAAGQRASWCDNHWCYIDPTHCELVGAGAEFSNYGWMTTDCEEPLSSCRVTYSYATCGGHDAYTDQPHIEKTRGFMVLLMMNFMEKPLNIIATTLPLLAEEGQFVSLADRQGLSDFAYAQTVALRVGVGVASAYSMLYAGLEDGLFVGFFSPTSYTLRAAGGRAEDVPWAPYTLATVNAACAAAPGACRGVDGKTVQRSGTCPPNNATCIDSNIRNYYTTSPENSGRPIAFTRWKTYDPRVFGPGGAIKYP